MYQHVKFTDTPLGPIVGAAPLLPQAQDTAITICDRSSHRPQLHSASYFLDAPDWQYTAVFGILPSLRVPLHLCCSAAPCLYHYGHSPYSERSLESYVSKAEDRTLSKSKYAIVAYQY